MKNTQYIAVENHEIDLFEIWEKWVDNKILILVITLFSSVVTGAYVWNIPPTYTGNAIIEVGEIVNKRVLSNSLKQETIILKLDTNLVDLKEIATKMTNVVVTVPNGSDNIIQLSFHSNNASMIEPTIKKAVDFIISRHKEKVKLYADENSVIRMTQLVGDIHINEEPIKPNKQAMITAGIISGLLISIFYIHIRDFIKRNRRIRN